MWWYNHPNMNTSPEINAKIIDELSGHIHDSTERFVLVGSLGRGILMGKDVIDLHDPKDVDTKTSTP